MRGNESEARAAWILAGLRVPRRGAVDTLSARRSRGRQRGRSGAARHQRQMPPKENVPRAAMATMCSPPMLAIRAGAAGAYPAGAGTPAD